jgi:hypothetical protein
MFWQYNDISETSPLIGCEFCVVKKGKKNKEYDIEIRLITNDKNAVVVKNEAIAFCVMTMFAPKLIKDGKVFFHWNHIQEWEEKLHAEKAKGRKT